MDRRAFFRRGLGKVTEVAVKAVDKRASEKAKHWIRPPYAKTELDFLLSCTRCNACIEACPHNIIFPLAARLGADVVNTPALDLLKKGCSLCEGWPCVNACEANALVLSEADEDGHINIPKFAAAEIDTDTCLPYSGPECGACGSACPIKGALIFERERPTINMEHCIGCALCRDVCIVEDKAINIKPL
ncbi:MAG: 4Fe-4S binding protein [Woeseiaceae bacterium]